jgi:hypothetical protein
VSTTLAAAVLATGLRLVASHGYAEGAPPGFSGGFKEDSCHACHFHEPLNAAPGRVTIEGAPARYTPGQRYTLTVTLARAEMKRAGFQLTVRFAGGGAQAGSLAPVPDEASRVHVERQGEVAYAGQTAAGSAVDTPGRARWRVEWTAPDGGGPVALHLSANAANGDETAEGDFVYTATAGAAGFPGACARIWKRRRPRRSFSASRPASASR